MLIWNSTHFFAVGSDFGGGPFIASFPAGSAMSSVNVPILDDQLQEDDETFSAQLQIPDDVPDSVVSGANATAQVVIKDNEADIVINFNPTKYEVSEGAQFVELTLVASRPAAVPYSINVTTMDGTAQGMVKARTVCAYKWHPMQSLWLMPKDSNSAYPVMDLVSHV